jgi:hypothetical protein
MLPMLAPPPRPSADPPWRLSVLNPGGRDPAQAFPDGAGAPDDPRSPHPPVNHHAYAACTHGTFHTRTATAIAAKRPILLLLRRDLSVGIKVLLRLKAADCTVAVAFKEAGAVQLAGRLQNASDLSLLQRILRETDGFIAATPALETMLSALRDTGCGAPHTPGVFIPPPYPVDDERWNFARHIPERRGILIGTREFAVPARQHLAAILAALQIHRRTGSPVTVVNIEGFLKGGLLRQLGFSKEPAAPLRVVKGPLAYADYLREMARHRLVFQLDRSGVPGQVAGDALLCRLPCVGGDGAVEQIAYPDLAGHDKSPSQLVDIAAALLTDPLRYEQAVDDGQKRALASLSFRVTAARLEAYFDSLGAGGQ